MPTFADVADRLSGGLRTRAGETFFCAPLDSARSPASACATSPPQRPNIPSYAHASTTGRPPQLSKSGKTWDRPLGKMQQRPGEQRGRVPSHPDDPARGVPGTCALLPRATPPIGSDKSGVERMPTCAQSQFRASHPLAMDAHTDSRSLAHHAAVVRQPWTLHHLRVLSSALLERGGKGKRWLSDPRGVDTGAALAVELMDYGCAWSYWALVAQGLQRRALATQIAPGAGWSCCGCGRSRSRAAPASARGVLELQLRVTVALLQYTWERRGKGLGMHTFAPSVSASRAPNRTARQRDGSENGRHLNGQGSPVRQGFIQEVPTDGSRPLHPLRPSEGKLCGLNWFSVWQKIFGAKRVSEPPEYFQISPILLRQHKWLWPTRDLHHLVACSMGPPQSNPHVPVHPPPHPAAREDDGAADECEPHHCFTQGVRAGSEGEIDGTRVAPAERSASRANAKAKRGVLAPLRRPRTHCKARKLQLELYL
ncbi:hypothetical protein K438DRAFT_1785157 [Mycena galopus ATCC 62051]|nr:hypothetical protein K438DRAFT_1785157 [Mycena galopus ATCC 62051]